jgi:hypothetical protein
MSLPLHRLGSFPSSSDHRAHRASKVHHHQSHQREQLAFQKDLGQRCEVWPRITANSWSSSGSRTTVRGLADAEEYPGKAETAEIDSMAGRVRGSSMAAGREESGGCRCEDQPKGSVETFNIPPGHQWPQGFFWIRRGLTEMTSTEKMRPDLVSWLAAACIYMTVPEAVENIFKRNPPLSRWRCAQRVTDAPPCR